MKKQTLFALAGLLALTAVGFALINRNAAEERLLAKTEKNVIQETDQNMVSEVLKTIPDFIHGIGPRFSGIKKSEIDKITSIDAFLEDELIQHMSNIKSTSITLVLDEKLSTISVHGSSATFTKAQLDLLQSSNYSTNFSMRVDFDERDPKSGHIFDSYRSPHHTIVPEQQAYYSDGEDALKLFLKENCQSVLINVDPERLKPARLYFTITKDGTIENLKLDSGSGYPEVDKKMVELIHQLPGTWIPAKNSSGETVNQELVVFFGLMGC